ncbi:MAG: hypothetical protein V1758_16630 [Pseudomonadota bacterium]
MVREALRSLEQSRLIEIRHGLTGGAFRVYSFQKPLFDLLKRLRPDFSQTTKFMKEPYKRHTAIIQTLREKDIPLSEELMAADVKQTRKLRHARFK